MVFGEASNLHDTLYGLSELGLCASTHAPPKMLAPMPRPITLVPMLTPKALVPMLLRGNLITRTAKARQCYGRFVLRENISSHLLSYAFPRITPWTVCSRVMQEQLPNSMGTRKHQAFVGWSERFSNPNILSATICWGSCWGSCLTPTYGTKTLVPMLLDNCSCVVLFADVLSLRVGTFYTRTPKTRQCYESFVLRENISSHLLSYAFPRGSMGTREHKAFVGWGELFL